MLGNVHSTDLAPNGWAGDGEHIEGGYQLTVDSAWEQVWIERAVNAPLEDVLAGLDIVASPIQYVGLHFETTDGRFLTYEEEPSYGGALWSNDSWAGVSAGMGYTAFGQPAEFVAQNGDVMVKTVYLLYTHPTGSVTDITSASFDCTLFTFDKEGDLTTLGPVVPFAEFKDLTCEADGSITFGNNETAPGAAEPAVTWTVNGAAMTEGTYPVTAAGAVSLVATAVGPEYFFDLDTVSEFEHQFTEPTGCDLPTLALTGTNSTPTFAIATLLGLLGVALAGHARRNARLDFTS